MNGPPDELSPLGRAIQWVGVGTTAAAMMVLPTVVGQWLDDRWGTRYLALVGIAVGLSTGIYYLVVAANRMQMTSNARGRSAADQRPSRDASDRNEPPDTPDKP